MNLTSMNTESKSLPNNTSTVFFSPSFVAAQIMRKSHTVLSDVIQHKPPLTESNLSMAALSLYHMACCHQ